MIETFSPRLSFWDPAGGVARAAKSEPENLLLQHDTFVFLIHGFNNDQDEASAAFSAYRDLQRELGPVNALVVGVYWPGDNWAEPLFYPASVGRARETAVVLARELERAARGRLLRLDVIAHSLGCRLALELLDNLARIGARSVQIRRVAMMAAAVPVFQLRREAGQPRPLRDALDRTPGGTMSLHSRGDDVLRLAFPLGQSLAPGPEGFFPIALGRREFAGPGAAVRPVLVQHEIRGANHGHYWGTAQRPRPRENARRAARHVREFLALGTPLPRSIEGRSTEARGEVAEREAAPPRGTPARAATR